MLPKRFEVENRTDEAAVVRSSIGRHWPLTKTAVLVKIKKKEKQQQHSLTKSEMH